MADDFPGALLAHRIPRRLRVRVPSRKGDRAYFEEAVDRLRGEPSIRSVRASARTASITIEHDGHAREVARSAREAGVFDLPEAAVAPLPAEESAGKIVGIAPSAVAAAGLAGLGVLQLARGRVLGSGVEHAWQAYGAARTLGRPGVASVLALLGALQIARGRVLNPAASLFFYALMARVTDKRG